MSRALTAAGGDRDWTELQGGATGIGQSCREVWQGQDRAAGTSSGDMTDDCREDTQGMVGWLDRQRVDSVLLEDLRIGSVFGDL